MPKQLRHCTKYFGVFQAELLWACAVAFVAAPCGVLSVP
jgi:hypothetical protein